MLIKKKLLINALNLYTGGSKTISQYIFNDLNKLKKYKTTIIIPKNIEKSLNLKGVDEIISINYPKNNFNFLFKLYIDHIHVFFLCHFKKIDLVINCGNFSNFFISKNKQLTLLHNIFYLYKFKIIKKYLNLRMFLEIFLFNICSNHKSAFIVQNNFVKNKIIEKFQTDKKKIFIADFYKAVPILFNKINNKVKSKKINLNKKKKNIIFPYHYYENKNFDKLYLFDEIITKNRLNFNIYLTIDNKDYFNLKKNYNLKNIFNLGKLNTNQLYNFYEKFDFILNLSKFESMCLPLYEAIFFSKNIISIKADFILKKVKNRSIILDSFKKQKIEKVLKLALKLKFKKSKSYLNYFKSRDTYSFNGIIDNKINS